MNEPDIQLGNCWTKMPETKEVWDQCVAEMCGALKLVQKSMEMMRQQKLLSVEGIKALDPDKIYAVKVDMGNPDCSSSVDLLGEAAKQYNLRFIITLDGVDFISVPEGLEVIQHKEPLSNGLLSK